MPDRGRGKKKASPRKYATSAYPKNTLKEALVIAQAITDNNAGEPYNRLDVAQSIGSTPESSKFPDSHYFVIEVRPYEGWLQGARTRAYRNWEIRNRAS